MGGSAFPSLLLEIVTWFVTDTLDVVLFLVPHPEMIKLIAAIDMVTILIRCFMKFIPFCISTEETVQMGDWFHERQ
ncbi:hypothetical protein BM613_08520 [Sulfoacidibacillus thermotolerans]|uniref:Uncharacterized protein n=1 Tax=Sulfoacidibacillus thermotolerans TaxID=1765684 RepID=A0A2U3D887_SULT2|nr:hypothetical protein BM613_08520 [Sulfoacidibacillus thermotolerans]